MLAYSPCLVPSLNTVRAKVIPLTFISIPTLNSSFAPFLSLLRILVLGLDGLPIRLLLSPFFFSLFILSHSGSDIALFLPSRTGSDTES